MGQSLPIADEAPLDGALPARVSDGASDRTFSAYVHVPFCRVRCGYCDFNTYTADELRGVKRGDYASQVELEIDFAAARMREVGMPERELATVFVGGGTPTLLDASDLVRILDRLRSTWGFADDAEVTVEANPDTVTTELVATLAHGGVTRMSVGMQSAVPDVLATLDRSHTPSNVTVAVGAARAAGLQVSVDLIYGTPGESLADWRESISAALALDPDHISAYALIVEQGTALARKVQRGELAAPDDDLMAEMYELADREFTAAGFAWYELSNWSTEVSTQSRHNLAYWQSQDWWGFGPGAHSHVGGVRFWNVKHPAAYADRLRAGQSPAAGIETLTDADQTLERVLLTSRLATGVDLTKIAHPEQVAALIADGLIDGTAALRGRGVLTVRGRLLADVVARRLSD